MIFSEDQFNIMEKQQLIELFKKYKDITILSDEGKIRLYCDPSNIICLTHVEYYDELEGYGFISEYPDELGKYEPTPVHSDESEEYEFIIDINFATDDIKEAVSNLVHYYGKTKAYRRLKKQNSSRKRTKPLPN